MQVTKLFKTKKNNEPLITGSAVPEAAFSADSAPAEDFLAEAPPVLELIRPEELAENARLDKLVASAQKGSLEAFNELVTCYEQRVYNLSYRLLGDGEAAADATQDTFFQAYRALGQYRGGSFKSWLLRIASNLCYDQLRVRARRPSSSLEALLEEAEEGGGAVLSYMEDEGSDPQDHALRHELLREVGLALQELPYEQRLVVVLSDVQGLSYDEIVEVTNSSLGTVKSRLSRGRLKLREILQKNRELLPGEFRP